MDMLNTEARDVAPANSNWPKAPAGVRHIAPDCQGLNFYAIDPSFQASLRVNMDANVLAHFPFKVPSTIA